jgi:hypothetical protein
VTYSDGERTGDQIGLRDFVEVLSVFERHELHGTGQDSALFRQINVQRTASQTKKKQEENITKLMR